MDFNQMTDLRILERFFRLNDGTVSPLFHGEFHHDVKSDLLVSKIMVKGGFPAFVLRHDMGFISCRYADSPQKRLYIDISGIYSELIRRFGDSLMFPPAFFGNEFMRAFMMGRGCDCLGDNCGTLFWNERNSLLADERQGKRLILAGDNWCLGISENRIPEEIDWGKTRGLSRCPRKDFP